MFVLSRFIEWNVWQVIDVIILSIYRKEDISEGNIFIDEAFFNANAGKRSQNVGNGNFRGYLVCFHVFTFNCRTDVDEDYGLFLKPILTVIGATVMNPSTFEDEDGMCCTIQPTRMSMTVGTDYNTLSITYPPFFKEIYGVEIPSGESITLWCYLYDCSNNGGCNFWIGS